MLTSFGWSVLIFNKMALIFIGVPITFIVYWACECDAHTVCTESWKQCGNLNALKVGFWSRDIDKWSVCGEQFSLLILSPFLRTSATILGARFVGLTNTQLFLQSTSSPVSRAWLSCMLKRLMLLIGRLCRSNSAIISTISGPTTRKWPRQKMDRCGLCELTSSLICVKRC